jgi:hypothetical protein
MLHQFVFCVLRNPTDTTGCWPLPITLSAANAGKMYGTSLLRTKIGERYNRTISIYV